MVSTIKGFEPLFAKPTKKCTSFPDGSSEKVCIFAILLKELNQILT